MYPLLSTFWGPFAPSLEPAVLLQLEGTWALRAGEQISAPLGAGEGPGLGSSTSALLPWVPGSGCRGRGSFFSLRLHLPCCPECTLCSDVLSGYWGGSPLSTGIPTGTLPGPMGGRTMCSNKLVLTFVLFLYNYVYYYSYHFLFHIRFVPSMCQALDKVNY